MHACKKISTDAYQAHTDTHTLYLSADATAHCYLISSTDSQGTHTCTLYLSADDATASATEFIQKLELGKRLDKMIYISMELDLGTHSRP